MNLVQIRRQLAASSPRRSWRRCTPRPRTTMRRCFDAVVKQIVAQRSQAVVVVADPMFLNERARLHAAMQVARLPVAYSPRQHVVEGGLLSYSADLAAMLRYAAKYAHRILKGARPADLPVEQPTKFDLVINLKTARSLGLTIAKSLLVRADEVIE